jgi:serine phosphatase RsbU (regulator of sigma subunit)
MQAMFVNRFCLLLYLLFVFNGLSALSKSNSDSLLRVLAAHPADTIKVNTLLQLYRETSNTKPDLALNYSREAFELSKKLNFQRGIARSANNLALAHKNKGDFDKALSFFTIAINAADLLGDKALITGITNNTAIVLKKQGNYARAIDMYYKGMHAAEESGDQKMQSAILQNIALIYLDQQDYKLALEMLEKTLFIKQKINDPKGEALVYLNLATCYDELNRQEEALRFYHKSLELFYHSQDLKNSGIVLNQIGEIYLSEKKYDSALVNFEKGKNLLTAMQDKEGLAKISNNLGEYYFIRKDYQKSLGFLKDALYLGETIGSQKIRHDAANVLAKVYFEQRNFEKAYQYRILYETLKDSLTNDELLKRITRAEMQYLYDKEKRQKEFEQNKKDIEQRLVTRSLIVAFLLVFIIAVVIFRNYRQKQKANLLLAKQNAEIESQRNEIAAKNYEIMSSIRYASRIQKAILPDEALLNEKLSEYFVLYKPKDIVSGDFYFVRQVGPYMVLAAADCTGHGVPGAFMSMLGIAYLNEIIIMANLSNPGEILDILRDKVKASLHQTGKDNETKDGMDIALCTINMQDRKLWFAGAYNPLYLIRNGVLTEYRADRMPIGIHFNEKANFSMTEMDICPGDCLYFFSDGYQDQIGGNGDKKFLAKNFRKLLTEIYNKPLAQQKMILDETIENWRGNYEQIDDILVMGIKLM